MQTRIIATVSHKANAETIRKLIKSGSNCVRYNAAYGTPEDCDRVFGYIRKHFKDVPLLLDIKGRQIRLYCRSGSTITLNGEFAINGDQDPVFTTHKLANLVSVGGIVSFGKRARAYAEIISIQGESLRLRMLGGKSIAVGNGWIMKLGNGEEKKLPAISVRDLGFMQIGIVHKVDFVAQSFCHSLHDLEYLASSIQELSIGSHYVPTLVPKIEDRHGIELSELITSKEVIAPFPIAFMIARGDLHENVPKYALYAVQRRIMERTVALDIPSIIASGFLVSMQDDSQPRISEIGDIVNALRDRPDWLMLCGDTANSQWPEKVVETLRLVMTETEKIFNLSATRATSK